MALLPGIAAFYAALSLLTLATYARDKRAARKGSRRTPERTLHALAIAGGFFGALLGQAWLRHKTRHPVFLLIALSALVAHGGGWFWWLRGTG